MKKYTITDQEWESVLNKVHTIEKENLHLKGVIDGLEKALTLYNVGQQRKLLIAFMDAFDEDKINCYQSADKMADEFLAIYSG